MKILQQLRSRLSSMDSWTIVFIVLVIIYILPIWIFKFFPSQDGPCHIYNSFIIRRYNDPDYVFSEYYGIRKSPIPNWTSHAVMTLLMYVFTPLIAEKLLLTGYIVLMAVSILYFVNAVGSGRIPLAFLGFPLIYNYLFLMGFYNFSIGVALFILSVGYWWDHYDTFGVKNMITLSLLLVALYFCHLVPLVLAAFSISVIAVLYLPFDISRWKKALLSLSCMIPASALALYYVGTRGTAQTAGSWTLRRLLQYFIRSESLAYYSQSQITFGIIYTALFAAFFLYTLGRDKFLTENWKFRLRLQRKDFLLLICITFFIIYLKAPDAMSGGGFIKTRMAFMPLLIIIPWLSWDMPKIARKIAGILAVIFVVAYIAHAGYYHKLLNDDLKIYTSGYDSIEKNKVVLPLSFNHSGRCWRIGLFLHAVGHYGYETGCIDLDNYEATTNYFPTYFRSDFQRPDHSIIEAKTAEFDFATHAKGIDYIITWMLPPGSDVETRILEYYSLIKHNKELKIFKRRM